MSHWFMWRHKQRERFLVFAQLKLGDYTLKIQVGGSKAYLHATIRRRHDLYSSDDKDKTTVTPLSRPKTASRGKVSAVAQNVKVGSHICIYEMFSKFALLLGTVHKTLQGKLHMRKLAARWILHELTDVQKAFWVDISTYLFNIFESNGIQRLANMVIWNETWIYFFGFASKCRNAAWLGPEHQRHPVCMP